MNNQVKEMYVINLDVSRIFWFAAIGLLTFFFLFLLGYWVGSDSTVADNYIIDDTPPQNSIFHNVNNGQENRLENNSYSDSQFDLEYQSIETPETYTSHSSGRDVDTQQSENLDNRVSQTYENEDRPNRDQLILSPPVPTQTASLQTSQVSSHPQSSPTQATSASLNSSGDYVIQVGSHHSSVTAQEVLEQLKEKGYDAFITTAEVNNRTVHRIRLGRFESQQQAQTTRNQLVNEMNNISGIENAMIMKVQ